MLVRVTLSDLNLTLVDISTLGCFSRRLSLYLITKSVFRFLYERGVRECIPETVFTFIEEGGNDPNHLLLGNKTYERM